MEFIAKLKVFCTALLCITFSAFYFPAFFGPPSSSWFLLIHDSCLVYYHLYKLTQGAFFYTSVSIFAAITYVDYSEGAFAPVQIIIKQRLLRRSSRPLPQFIVRRALAKFHQVCYLTLAGNRTLFGRILLAYLITNVPLNIGCIFQLAFGNKSYQPYSFQTFILQMVIFYQFWAAVTVFYPSAWSSAKMHEPSKMMPLMVEMINESHLTTKLKVDDLFLRLTWGPKLASQVGPIRQVTYQTSFEVCGN